MFSARSTNALSSAAEKWSLAGGCHVWRKPNSIKVEFALPSGVVHCGQFWIREIFPLWELVYYVQRVCILGFLINTAFNFYSCPTQPFILFTSAPVAATVFLYPTFFNCVQASTRTINMLFNTLLISGLASLVVAGMYSCPLDPSFADSKSTSSALEIPERGSHARRSCRERDHLRAQKLEPKKGHRDPDHSTRDRDSVQFANVFGSRACSDYSREAHCY